MKVLILNGSPRPDGDTVCILERVKSQFHGDTVFSALNAYGENIQPCNDCRYCWEKEGCCVRDKMDILLKDDYDVLIIASPLYMSFVTPPLFAVISRLNFIWSNHYFLKISKELKPKKGILKPCRSACCPQRRTPTLSPAPPPFPSPPLKQSKRRPASATQERHETCRAEF